MKKLFNHTKRPDRNWEEDVQDGYDWDEEQDGEEYYADDEEYTGDEDGEEYYADDEEYTGDEDGEEYYADDEEYTGDEDGEEYYADDEEYTGDEDGEEYYADDEEYTGDEDGEEYYADDEEYIGDEDGEEYYADDEEYTGDEDGEEYYADDEEYLGEEDGEEYYADDDMAPAHGGKGKKSKKQGGNKIAAIWTKFLNMSTMDRIMTATGVAVLILAIVTGSVYASARMVDHQVSEFVSVGSQLDGIQMIGEQGMLAVADAKLAKIAAANAVDDENEEQKEYDEAEYTNGGTVELELVSVQKDLKIKFTNKKSGKLISNVPFSVTITDPNGKSDTWTDDDMDGIIYKKGITPGNYTVAVNTLTDEKYKDYTLPTGTQKVEVRKDIAYKKVDVANEIKKESEVNAAKEDTMKNDTVVESILEDTVQWVESKKLPPTYREVAKDTVVNPEKQTAYSGRFLRIANEQISIKVGETKQLTPPTGATVVGWSSNNPDVASVNDGVVTGWKAGGPVTITCTYTEAGSATPTPTTPGTGGTTTTTPDSSGTTTTTPDSSGTTTTTPDSSGTTGTPTGGTGEDGSSNESQATQQSVGGGSLPIAYAQVGSTQKTYTWEVTVTEVQKPTAALEPASLNVEAGKEATAQVKVTNFTGATYQITANSNDKAATATVDANGKITVNGVAAGDAKITVTVTMGTETKKLDLEVKVTNGIKITLDKTAVTVYPKSTATVTATVSGSGTIAAPVSSDDKIATATISGKTITVTGVKKGTATITVTYKEGSAEAKATFTVTVAGDVNPREDTKTPLKDTSGRQLYVSIGDNQYRAAVYADYYTATKFFLMEESRYTGWQTLDGKVYFFKADGSKVTGEQVIQGAKYNFASDGSLVVGSGTMGIDVSKWNGSIDWNAVKNSGVNYVIIRVGYRGSSQGALIEDPKFKTNIKGATAAGLKVGVYFFTQAVDEVEAVQEASMVLDRISGYKISYPVFLDVEGSGGRGDAIDSATRTAVCKAFCNTIKNAGYTPGVYANKTWLTSKMDAGALSGYKIWLAQYAKTPTYTGRYDLWQYRSDGKVSGISGKVDLNISYLGY